MKSEKLIEELNQISPLLSQLKSASEKKDFEVPPQYFQHLMVDVMQKIEAEKQNVQAPKPSFWQSMMTQTMGFFAPRAALGFASLCLLGIIYFLYPVSHNTNVTVVSAVPESAQKHNIETITSEDATAYIEANIDDFDEKTILETEAEYSKIQPKTKDLNINDTEINHLLNKIIEQEQLTDEELENLL